MDNFGLHAIITNPVLPYTAVAEVFVECGIRYLQLREKHVSDRDLLRMAGDIRGITKGSKTFFVVNDRADIALLCGADCLHLGQDDLSMAEARKIVGGDMQIGLSTHSISQAKRALELKPSYIGFGPIYPTTTKEHPDPIVGLELLSQVVGFSKVPVVAIGGIFEHNLADIVGAGARNYSLVRHLMQSRTREELKAKIEALKVIVDGH